MSVSFIRTIIRTFCYFLFFIFLGEGGGGKVKKKTIQFEDCSSILFRFSFKKVS